MRHIFMGLVLVVVAATQAKATLTIWAGEAPGAKIKLEPNKPDQVVPIYVLGDGADTMIAGMTLYVTIGNGPELANAFRDNIGSELDYKIGPKITGISLQDTIWGSNPGDASLAFPRNFDPQSPVASFPTQIVSATFAPLTAGAESRADGVVARVMIDTTGFSDVSAEWSFELVDGWDEEGAPGFLVSQFGHVGGGPATIATNAENTLAVPEPSTWLLAMAGIGLAALAGLRRRRRRRQTD